MLTPEYLLSPGFSALWPQHITEYAHVSQIVARRLLCSLTWHSLAMISHPLLRVDSDDIYILPKLSLLLRGYLTFRRVRIVILAAAAFVLYIILRQYVSLGFRPEQFLPKSRWV
jgi:hypothetical protein